MFVIKTLDSPGGGAERVLAALTSELVERRHQVTVLTFDALTAVDFYTFDPRVLRVKVPIGLVTAKAGVLDTLRRVRALRTLIRGQVFDVAIGFMHSAYVPLGVALIGNDVPVVASEHSPRGYFLARPFENLVVNAISALFDRITITSEAVRSEFPPHLARRMVVLPNPVASGVDHLADAVGPPSKTLLTVGRLGEEKDHRTLLEAFASLATEHSAWNLRIVGEGKLRSALEKQIWDLGLQDRVRLPGVVQDISMEYRNAQLFVHPSKYESFGLATAEALAHGLPAVGFIDCPGTNELIEHEVNGLLAQGSNRIAALTEALDKLMRSDQLRAQYGSAGPRSIEKHSIKTIADQWETLLRSVSRVPTIQANARIAE